MAGITVSPNPIHAGEEVRICYTFPTGAETVRLTIQGDDPDDFNHLDIKRNPVDGTYCAPWTPPYGWVAITITGPGNATWNGVVLP